MEIKLEKVYQQETEVLTKEKTDVKLKTKKELAIAAAASYEKLNQQEKLINARRQKILRPIIEEAVKLYGLEDQSGHIHLDEGDVEIVLEARVKPVFNQMVAEKILKEKNLLEDCIVTHTITELNETRIFEAYEAGLLTAGDIDSMFSDKTSYALKVHVNSEEVHEITTLRKSIEKGVVTDMPFVEMEDEV